MVNKELLLSDIHVVLLDCKNTLQNYVFFIIDKQSNECAVIDPFNTPLVIEFLATHKLCVKYIFNTHHHHDHIDGNHTILEHYPDCLVFGHHADKYRIETITNAVHHDDMIALFDGKISFKVLNLDGHTLGHVGYYEQNLRWLFSGDTLFNLGCGRLFEGTASHYLETFQRIESLPKDTLIYATHEYTSANIEFSHSIIPETYSFYPEFLDYCKQQKNLRDCGKPTIPFTLQSQKMFNPFLLYDNTQLKAYHNIQEYNAKETIKYFRVLKDKY